MKRVILLIFLCVLPQLAVAGEYYYLATYDLNSEGYVASISVKKINLKNATIVDSLSLGTVGCLLNEKPFKINYHGKDALLFFVQDGMVAKNTGPGPETSYLFCVDRSLNLKNFIITKGAGVFPCLRDGVSNGFYLEIQNDSSAAINYPDGIYFINNELNFVRIDSLPGAVYEEIFVNPFKWLIKIPGDLKHNLYYGWKDSQYWLVKLDSVTQTVQIYSQLRFSGGAATLFAYHPRRNLFYCLKVNYEIPSDEPDFKPKTRLDYYIDPEAVIYDPESLDIIKRIPIADYPDGEYPGKENGLADVVGDYIVYYFFREEHYTRYDPAMLLIFDTRTNEATWLRVGWR
jgi:hypothetical protein